MVAIGHARPAYLDPQGEFRDCRPRGANANQTISASSVPFWLVGAILNPSSPTASLHMVLRLYSPRSRRRAVGVLAPFARYRRCRCAQDVSAQVIGRSCWSALQIFRRWHHGLNTLWATFSSVLMVAASEMGIYWVAYSSARRWFLVAIPDVLKRKRRVNHPDSQTGSLIPETFLRRRSAQLKDFPRIRAFPEPFLSSMPYPVNGTLGLLRLGLRSGRMAPARSQTTATALSRRHGTCTVSNRRDFRWSWPSRLPTHSPAKVCSRRRTASRLRVGRLSDEFARALHRGLSSLRAGTFLFCLSP